MEKIKREKLRQCIGCRESHPKEELIRIIRTPEGEIELDLTGRKNGRGAYLCRNKLSCLENAQKRKTLERALKKPVDGELFERLRENFENAENT